MEALVVKVKYAPDHDEAKKPVVMIEVTNNPVGRAADEGNEFPQGTHLNRLRVGFEPLSMSASEGALWSNPRGRAGGAFQSGKSVTNFDGTAAPAVAS